MYKVKYMGCGQIEVDLPSYPTGVVIKHGQYARLNLTNADKKTIKSLRHLGLSYEEEVVKKEVKVEIPKEEPKIDPVVEEPVEEKNSDVSKEELMKKTALELKGILKSLGEDEIPGTKSGIADRILEIKNDTSNT